MEAAGDLSAEPGAIYATVERLLDAARAPASRLGGCQPVPDAVAVGGGAAGSAWDAVGGACHVGHRANVAGLGLGLRRELRAGGSQVGPTAIEGASLGGLDRSGQLRAQLAEAVGVIAHLGATPGGR